MILLKIQISNLYFCVCSLLEAPCQFSQKNINIWAPWSILKMKTLTCVRAPKFWNWTSTIIPDLLWLLDLFRPIKNIFHTPPYCMGGKMLCFRLQRTTNTAKKRQLILGRNYHPQYCLPRPKIVQLHSFKVPVFQKYVGACN